jgi:hypothetical protein
MCGNNKFILFAVVCCLLAGLQERCYASSRPLEDAQYRLGVEYGPHLKFINGSNWEWVDFGLLFKINENITFMPFFSFYSHNERTFSSGFGPDTASTGYSFGVIIRYEFLTKVDVENTKYEYNVETREFMHYKYYSPIRPYVQLYAGNFIGVGGGISYYFSSSLSLGIGSGFGYNCSVNRGLGMLAPQIKLQYAFGL